MIIEVRNGNFSYDRKVKILNDINFTLEEGKVLSILGPNGIGKTTLLKCITGLLNWNSGESFLYGKNIKNLKEREVWSKISYIPQIHSFTFSYTGLEMVLIGKSVNLGAFAQPGKKDFEEAHKIMKKIGITHLADKDCNKMSGGEFQMILIARALISKPKLIIVDEIETGLDFHNQILILNLLKKLSEEENISVIMNTHYPNNAMSISDYSLLLNIEGKHLYGKTEEILTGDNIEKTFDVKVILEKVEKDGKTYVNILPIGID